MANDSSLLPTAPAAPVAAVLTTSSAGTGATANNAIAYDYSPHLIRIVTALEQLSLSMAFIADKIDNVSDKLTDLATQSSIQSSLLSSMAAAVTPGSTTIGAILSDVAQASENSARALEGIYDRATGDGIHMKGPLDWLGLVSTYKLYVENVGPENVTLEGLIAYKAKIDALPKEF
jgi:hypothetical protein